jgi:hypothetical protein
LDTAAAAAVLHSMGFLGLVAQGGAAAEAAAVEESACLRDLLLVSAAQAE